MAWAFLNFGYFKFASVVNIMIVAKQYKWVRDKKGVSLNRLIKRL